MKYLIFFIFFYLVSCSDSSKSVSKKQEYAAIEENVDNGIATGQGTIIATVLRQNTPFHAFYFKISQILLVNSITGETVPLTPPNNQININHSSIFELSEILAINHTVPEGTYNQAYITLSFDNSLILPSNQPDSQFQLVDITLTEIPEEKSDFMINAYIGNQEGISVTNNHTSHIEFVFDIEASTKYILLDKKKLGIMLIPQMTINTNPTNKKMHINGRLDKLTDTHVDITHLYKIRPKVPERAAKYAYTIDNSVIFYNGIAENNLRFDSEASWIDLYGSLAIKDDDIALSIDHLSLVDNLSQLKLFQGIVIENKNKQLIVSGFINSLGYTEQPILSNLTNQAIHIHNDTLFYHEGNLSIPAKDIKITTGQSVRMTLNSHDKTFTAHSIYIQPSRILGEVTKIANANTIKIKPLSYNNTDRTSSNYTNFFNDEITLKKRKDTYAIGQLIDLKGYQASDADHTFHSLNEEVINPSDRLVFTISLPTVPVFKNMEIMNENSLVINLNEKIYNNSAFLKIRFEKSNAQYRSIKNISSVIIDTAADKNITLTISIDGTDPVQSFMFDDINEFLAFMDQKINDPRFFFNEAIFYGNINNDKMTSNRLSLVIVDNERKKTKPTITVDSDDDLDHSMANNEGLQKFLAIALPILVPLGVTVAITLLVNTISISWENLCATWTISKNNGHIKTKIQEEKSKKIYALLDKISKNKNTPDNAKEAIQDITEDFTNELESQTIEENTEIDINDKQNNNLDKLKQYQDYDLDTLKEGVPKGEKFNAMISLLKINREYFNILYSRSPNQEIKDLVIIHNTLIEYLKGFKDNTQIIDKINNANAEYEELINRSKEVEKALINDLDSIFSSKTSKELTINIDEYTRSIDKIFISNSKKRVVAPDDIDKKHIRRMHSNLQNQMNNNVRVRNIYK